MSDAMGDRMKLYEMAEAGRKFMPLLPVVARLDGKCFSSFTNGLERPYDARLSDLMIETTAQLVRETNANCGYCQSDEITLAWYSSTVESQIFFDGRIQKMNSVLAAMCSSYFNRDLATFIPERAGRIALFDCRVWSVPTLEEGANCFLWRELDATKNAIGMAASHYYSHNELMGKHSDEKQEMLFQKGVNFNDYPPFFKRGTFVQKRTVSGPFTTEELDALPPKHHARTNPNLVVERSEFRTIDMPIFSKVTNRVGVIFRGEEPQTAEKEETK